MPVPITVREEREEDFFDPYVHPDDSLWLPLDDAARDHVRLRHLWRDIVVLHDARVATADPLTRAVLGRYLILELCAAEDLVAPFGRHANAARPSARDAYRAESRAFFQALAPLASFARDARNTFVAHREASNDESPLEEMRRLRRFVELPDRSEFAEVLSALHRVMEAVRGLGVGSYGRHRVDPHTGRATIGRMTPIRPIV